jgi:hypothetical protein
MRFLRLAEAEGDRGDFRGMARWLDEYIGPLQKVRGSELPAVQADSLLQLASSLKVEIAR